MKILKIIILLIILSCFKKIRNLEFINKDINENLIIAIKENNVKKALKLIKKGADINYISNGKTILKLVIEKEDLKIIKAIVEQNIEDHIKKIYDLALEDFKYNIINLLKEKYKLEEDMVRSEKYFLFLCYTAELKEIKNFIKKTKISPKDVKDKGGRDALIIASLGNRVETYKMLVEKYDLNVNHKGSYGSFSFFNACKSENKELIEFILEKGFNIDNKDNNEYKALMISSEEGNIDIIKLLLEKGADVNAKNSKGGTALLIASKYRNLEVIKILLEKGADINNKDNRGCSSLMIASQKSHIGVVKLLLANGSNVNDKSNDGETALIIASRNDNEELVKLLLESEANIDDSNVENETALTIASSNDNIEMVKLLLKSGANFNDKIGNKILKNAICNENIKLLELLVKAGVSFTWDAELVKLLLKRGANPNNLIYDMGKTALMFAVEEGDVEMVKLLLEVGADISFKDVKQKTALIYLSEKMKNKNLIENKAKEDIYKQLAYIIIRKMSEDYTHLLIALNKNANTPQEAKDEANNFINILYFLQELPEEIFIEIIKAI